MVKLKNETKHKLKNAVIVGLCGLVAVTTAGAAVAFSKVDSVDLTPSNYQIATINEEGGLDKGDKSSIVSKFVDVKGMEISVEEDSTAGYIVHYYDAEKEYLSSTEKQTADYALEAPEDAKFARVEIVPNDDNYISIFEKSEYASQVKVSIDK